MVSRECSARVVVSAIVIGVVLLTGARNSTAQGLWSAPVTVAMGGGSQVAVDNAGNAVMVWTRFDGTASVVRGARFTAVTGTWAAPVDLSIPASRSTTAAVAMDGSGSAIAVWQRSNGTHDIAQAARYAVGTDSWSAAVDLSAPGADARWVRLSSSSSGHAVAVWTRDRGIDTIVQAAHFSPVTLSWGPTTDVSVPGQRAEVPAVAVNGSGKAVAVWSVGIGFQSSIRASHYDTSVPQWGAAATLAGPGLGLLDLMQASVGLDDGGNAIAVWRAMRFSTARSVIQTSRYLRSTAAWSSGFDLSPPGVAQAAGPLVVMESGGDAIASWTRFSLGVETRRFSVTQGWRTTVALSGPGETGLADHPVVSLDAIGNAVAVWVLYDDRGFFTQHSAFYPVAAGAWAASTTIPSGSSSPQVSIGGGHVVATWSSADLVQAAHATIPATPSLQPAAVNRPDVALTWTPPTSGPAPSAYTVVASLSPEGPLVATLPEGIQTSVVVQAPDGTYFVRVVATVAGTTIPSNQIAVVVGPTSVPSAPLALGATVTGSTFILAWNAPANASVAPVQKYVIEAGTAAGLTNLANFATESAATSFVTPPVPDGSYYIRLRGRNATGTGPPTSDLRVVVGPPPPGPPVLTGSVGIGGSVSLAWTAPTTGAVVTGYQLQAGTAPGLLNAAVLSLSATSLGYEAVGVLPGTYYVRVVATSAIGLGFSSNELVLVVP